MGLADKREGASMGNTDRWGGRGSHCWRTQPPVGQHAAQPVAAAAAEQQYPPRHTPDAQVEFDKHEASDKTPAGDADRGGGAGVVAAVVVLAIGGPPPTPREPVPVGLCEAEELVIIVAVTVFKLVVVLDMV